MCRSVSALAPQMGPRRAAKLLGVKGLATKEELRRAFRRASVSCHPDKMGEEGSQRFLELQEALAVLLARAATRTPGDDGTALLAGARTRVTATAAAPSQDKAPPCRAGSPPPRRAHPFPAPLRASPG